MITFSSAHMLAPDGRCKTFDAAADGYVRGEGCGVIVIKRLEDALRDGDRIRAVIRGSAINQDGASGGLTVPNGVAQQRVIADALKRADLEPRDVGYLEAHGTGTSLGDPIEAQAAGAVLGAGREPDQPLLMGSVKTNIGHLEAAAGIAGVIKVILSLENELLPQHLHFQNPSPHIPWDRLAVEVVKEATPWKRNGQRRIAGISSFGFAGTNAHVIVEEAPEQAVSAPAVPAPVDAPGGRRFSILPLSARTPAALMRLADEYRAWLGANPEATLADVCFTAGRGGRTWSTGPRWWSIRANPPWSCWARSPRSARRPVCIAENPMTHRRRRGCSPVRAANTPAWPGSCSTPSRCSPRR
ncbi:beta-ketoacyl synthase, C-terminal domain protein [Mycobacterium intracellulare 1956]|uniref:Beta-ketoacyl synthase, C-terminal domain protein n=1 Tax=Mycobacterium intracellulare 1956 TaxID=1299331 RepID=X8CPR4_MYCIT|nr:beta-ketoacyl synthase, C-terminal domain protein [Mycobacterium intracellulare 1956]